MAFILCIRVFNVYFLSMNIKMSKLTLAFTLSGLAFCILFDLLSSYHDDTLRPTSLGVESCILCTFLLMLPPFLLQSLLPVACSLAESSELNPPVHFSTCSIQTGRTPVGCKHRKWSSLLVVSILVLLTCLPLAHLILHLGFTPVRSTGD